MAHPPGGDMTDEQAAGWLQEYASAESPDVAARMLALYDDAAARAIPQSEAARRVRRGGGDIRPGDGDRLLPAPQGRGPAAAGQGLRRGLRETRADGPA